MENITSRDVIGSKFDSGIWNSLKIPGPVLAESYTLPGKSKTNKKQKQNGTRVYELFSTKESKMFKKFEDVSFKMMKKNDVIW